MLKAGAKAPSFTLDNLEGGASSLAEHLARGPVLVTLYKTGCPTCQLALPFLERISKGSLAVVAISQDDESATNEFRQTYGLSLTTLLDRKQKGYPVSNAFGITHVPSLFLVDSNGKILEASHGFSRQEIEGLGKRSGVKVFEGDDHVPEWKAG